MQEKPRLGLFAQGDSSFQILLPPELFKPGWISGGIADGVLNVAVSEVVLNEPRSGKNPAAVALGKKGGAARAKSLTPSQRKAIAKKAAKSRWKKK